MVGLDLRPLTLGEILDRTFTLYRRHFVLFAGLMAVPQLLVLGIKLTQTSLLSGPGLHTPALLRAEHALQTILVGLAVVIVTFIATLFAQGATIFAVSDLYLGRVATVSNCLRRAWSEIGTIFAVGLLNGIAVLVGFLFLIFPGVYVLCRFLVAVPAALIEQRNPTDGLSRSWNLTRSEAGRAFLLVLLYFAISFAAGMLIGLPLGIALVISKGNLAAIQFWTAIAQIGNTIVSILVAPILLISTSVFYFDLRVRKEAFDLQFMLDPTSERITPPGTGTVPSILS